MMLEIPQIDRCKHAKRVGRSEHDQVKKERASAKKLILDARATRFDINKK